MTEATGEADRGGLRVEFHARLKLEFHGSRVTSDAGPLAFRELDNALGLSELAGRWVVGGRATADMARCPCSAVSSPSAHHRLR
jgi:hypothetical protein